MISFGRIPFLHGPSQRNGHKRSAAYAKKQKQTVCLPIIETNAAGIDIGATQIFVAVPAGRDAEPIRSLETFTVELERLADWLEKCQIRTVAMESTGVYWIPLFQILE